MKDKLPQSVISRPKVGLDIPIHEWFRGPLQSYLQDTLSPEAIRQTGIFNPEAVSNLIGMHMRREANVGYHLWGLVTLLTWMKHWNVQAPDVYAPVAYPELTQLDLAAAL